FQAEDGIRDPLVTGVQTCALPIYPTQVRILLARLGDAASLREAGPQVVCESGGTQYNAATRGLLRDLRRHLDRAWARYAGADPRSEERRVGKEWRDRGAGGRRTQQ